MPQDLPVCCSLTSDALRERRKRVLGPFMQKVKSVERLLDAVEFRLGNDDEVLSAAAELIAVERQCCQFLTFELTAEQALGEIRLRLSGPPGTSEFLTSELGLT